VALTLAVAVAAGSLLDARVMSFAGRVRDFVRVTFPAARRRPGLVSRETRDVGSACIVEGRERVQWRVF